MRRYHKNPRKISRLEQEQLTHWLTELGDLSGIVHDLNSDEIIGGNQRGDVFDINKCQIELVQQLDAPDAQGTIAHGFIIWQGARYAYRQVRWTPEQCERANIVANKAGGDWDIEILLAEFERGDLLQWGFDDGELEKLMAELYGSLPSTEPANNPAQLWEGMPEFEQEYAGAHQVIKIHFDNDEAVQEFAAIIGQRLTDKTISIWYPERPERLVNQLGRGLVYTHESEP